MEHQTEEWALISFINAREPGNILREIAERRLVDMRSVIVKTNYARSRMVLNTETNEVFYSIKEAAEKFQIGYITLCNSIARNEKRFPFECI